MIIDYQPVQVKSIASMDNQLLVDTSLEAHRAALDRVAQAGAHPVSWVQLICELQRDWARQETVQPFREILFGSRDIRPRAYLEH